MYVVKEWSFKVSDDEDYTITIKVGEGQKGHSVFKDLNGKYVHDREELTHLLSSGRNMKGKFIRISTTASDISPDTNKVSVSYSMNGELIEADENPIFRDADEDNGSVYFITKIIFTS